MSPDVVLISDYPAPDRSHSTRSGVGSYTAGLARSMVREGLTVTVIAPSEKRAPSRYEDEGVSVNRSLSSGGLFLPKAVRLALRHGTPVVHLQHEAFLFGGLTSVAGLPLALTSLRHSSSAAVVTLHQVVEPDRVTPDFLRMHRVRMPAPIARRGAAVVQDLLVGMSDLAIVHEQAVASNLPGTVVIPHGIEDASTPSRSEARRALGLETESRLVVLCFGFIAPYKGLEIALQAAARQPEVKLVVAGGSHPRLGPSYAQQLRQRWGRVAEFVGPVPDAHVPLWHAAADLALFCHRSPHASSGSLAVSLAHGTPFLTTEPLARLTGAPHAVWVSTEPRKLAGRLSALAADGEALDGLRQVSRQMAVGRDWATVARRHMRLYEEALEASPTASTAAWARLRAQGQLEGP